MTQATAAYGAQFKIGDGGSPENFTTISEVRSISFPNYSVDTVDVTSHDSPGGWEEVISTIIRSGEAELGMNWIMTDSTHDSTDGLLSDLENRTQARNFQLVAPDDVSSQFDFSANVTNFSGNLDHDSEIDAEVTLKLTGQPTNP